MNNIGSPKRTFFKTLFLSLAGILLIGVVGATIFAHNIFGALKHTAVEHQQSMQQAWDTIQNNYHDIRLPSDLVLQTAEKGGDGIDSPARWEYKYSFSKAQPDLTTSIKELLLAQGYKLTSNQNNPGFEALNKQTKMRLKFNFNNQTMYVVAELE